MAVWQYYHQISSKYLPPFKAHIEKVPAQVRRGKKGKLCKYVGVEGEKRKKEGRQKEKCRGTRLFALGGSERVILQFSLLVLT